MIWDTIRDDLRELLDLQARVVRLEIEITNRAQMGPETTPEMWTRFHSDTARLLDLRARYGLT